MATSIDSIDHQTLLAELSELLHDTYYCWDEDWVGFSWRNYTYDHVQRVRALALAMGERAGAGLPLDYAALLHDITKSYDGEIVMKDGKRVLDENGFWRNETLMPARENMISRIYEERRLRGTVHSISGATVATELLKPHGFDEPFLAHVREIIGTHLKVDPDRSSLEGKLLYDADTIDANVGLPAFYRNIQITAHRLDEEYAQAGQSFADYLAQNLKTFLVPYLRDSVPNWINGKQNDFVGRMTTQWGRDVILSRIERLRRHLDGLDRELGYFDEAIENGRLAVVRRFFSHRDRPRLSLELAYLDKEWSPSAAASEGAAGLIADFKLEQAGLA